jgi:glucokinase
MKALIFAARVASKFGRTLKKLHQISYRQVKNKAVIGIDIGGTGTKLAIIDESGQILERSSYDTQSRKGAAPFIAGLTEAVNELRNRVAASNEIIGIGIGTPACNEMEGTITGAANMPFPDTETVPVRQLVAERCGLPTRLANDANVAALGEGQFGGAREMKNYILITLGTGVGSGVIVDGKIVIGQHGLASEFGHTFVVRDGRSCGCGQKGCIETYASATGIKRTVFELMSTYTQDSPLRNFSFHQLSARDITQAAKAGDFLAQEAFRLTGEILGYKIADLMVLFDPKAVFLAGGLALAGSLILDPARESLEKHTMPMFKGKCEIRLSQLGSEDAALLGAASLIYRS